jgi:hypothetical protein
MLHALVGKPALKVEEVAALAHWGLQAKIEQLKQALEGRITAHHRFMVDLSIICSTSSNRFSVWMKRSLDTSHHTSSSSSCYRPSLELVKRLRHRFEPRVARTCRRLMMTASWHRGPAFAWAITRVQARSSKGIHGSEPPFCFDCGGMGLGFHAEEGNPFQSQI